MISIIIPVYNVSRFLLRSVASVLAQSYQNIELILVDDGSTDGSSVMCDDLALTDTRIRVVHQTNAGASVARRVGIFEAKGKYLAFVDADDVVEHDYIERLYHALTEHNTMIAACDFIIHRENEAVSIVHSEDSRILNDQELHLRFFRYEFWGFGGKIYRREVFDGIYFPEATINEDYVVMAQLFQRYKQMAYMPVQLYHYIKHEGSLSNKKLSKRMMEEWTNKLWGYHFYSEQAPQWKRHAEAQASETCCKLIGTITQGGSPEEFIQVKKEMQSFLRNHLFSLLTNPHLLFGLKLMVIRRIFQS